MTYDEIISKVSTKLDLPVRLVDRTYRSYWKVVKEHISSLPLKEDLTEEEFMKLQPNVNIPSIGKLHVTLERYKKMKKMQEIRNNLKHNKDVTYNKD